MCELCCVLHLKLNVGAIHVRIESHSTKQSFIVNHSTKQAMCDRTKWMKKQNHHVKAQHSMYFPPGNWRKQLYILCECVRKKWIILKRLLLTFFSRNSIRLTVSVCDSIYYCMVYRDMMMGMNYVIFIAYIHKRNTHNAYRESFACFLLVMHVACTWYGSLSHT